MLPKILCAFLVATLAAAAPSNTCDQSGLDRQCGKPDFPENDEVPENKLLIDTVEKLNKLCKKYTPYMNCAVDFVSQCPKTGEAKYLQPMKDMFVLYQRVCAQDDAFKKDAVDMAKCLFKDGRKIIEKCGTPNYVTGNEGPDKVKELCEAYKKTEACNLKNLGEICGQRSVEVAKKLLHDSELMRPLACREQ